jgi:hypothetical protein
MSNNLVSGTCGLVLGIISLDVQNIQNVPMQPVYEIMQTSIGVLAYGIMGGVAGVLGKFIAVWAIKKIRQYFKIEGKNGKSK